MSDNLLILNKEKNTNDEKNLITIDQNLSLFKENDLYLQTIYHRNHMLIMSILDNYDSKVTKQEVALFIKKYSCFRQRIKEDKQDGKEYKAELNLIYATFTFLISQNDSYRISYEELVLKYPLIENEIPFPTSQQKEYLINFYFYLKHLLLIIKEKGRKGFLIDVPSLLEGSGKIYISGGCKRQSHERNVREMLAMELGQLKVHPRQSKNKGNQDENSSHPDSISSYVEKDCYQEIKKRKLN